MPKNTLEKERLTVYLTKEVAKMLKNAAADQDRSLTKQIERILKDWLVKNGYANLKKLKD